MAITMDSITRDKCLNVYMKAINSDLGVYISQYFSCAPKNSGYPQLFNEIKRRLENGKYKTIQEFLSDIEFKFQRISFMIGKETDVSLGLLTIFQYIKDTLPIKEKCSSQQVQKEISDIQAQFKILLPSIPDNLQEFHEMLKKEKSSIREVAILRPEIPKDTLFSNAELDVLTAQLREIRDDKEIGIITDIIQQNEPLYACEEESLEVNLDQCNPTTVSLLKKFISSQYQK